MTMTTRNVVRICTLLAAASLLATPAASAELVGPTAPADLTATATAPGEISLAWAAASSLLGVTSYRVYRLDAEGAPALAAELPPDQLAWTDAGLMPGSSVTYVVSATDLAGEGPASNPAGATTWNVPSAPVGVGVASGPGALGEATVSWSAPESDGGSAVLGYNVYRDGALVGTVDAGTLSFTQTGLTPLHAYLYTVTATNLVGEGAAGDAACGMASPWTPELGCTSVL